MDSPSDCPSPLYAKFAPMLPSPPASRLLPPPSRPDPNDPAALPMALPLNDDPNAPATPCCTPASDEASGANAACTIGFKIMFENMPLIASRIATNADLPLSAARKKLSVSARSMLSAAFWNSSCARLASSAIALSRLACSVSSTFWSSFAAAPRAMDAASRYFAASWENFSTTASFTPPESDSCIAFSSAAAAAASYCAAVKSSLTPTSLYAAAYCFTADSTALSADSMPLSSAAENFADSSAERCSAFARSSSSLRAAATAGCLEKSSTCAFDSASRLIRPDAHSAVSAFHSSVKFASRPASCSSRRSCASSSFVRSDFFAGCCASYAAMALRISSSVRPAASPSFLIFACSCSRFTASVRRSRIRSAHTSSAFSCAFRSRCAVVTLSSSTARCCSPRRICSADVICACRFAFHCAAAAADPVDTWPGFASAACAVAMRRFCSAI